VNPIKIPGPRNLADYMKSHEYMKPYVYAMIYMVASLLRMPQQLHCPEVSQAGSMFLQVAPVNPTFNSRFYITQHSPPSDLGGEDLPYYSMPCSVT